MALGRWLNLPRNLRAVGLPAPALPAVGLTAPALQAVGLTCPGATGCGLNLPRRPRAVDFNCYDGYGPWASLATAHGRGLNVPRPMAVGLTCHGPWPWA